MFAILLPLIYLSFISLGLPDAMLGAAWPSVAPQLGKTVSDLGLVSALSAIGAVISSLLSSKLIARFGTGKVMVGSVLLTAVMMLLFSYVNTYFLACVITLALGTGGGAVDAGLNGFVARNYKANHMSWLHFMWGVGATLGPVIIGVNLKGAGSWPAGYRTAALLQAILCAVLFLSLPWWRKAEGMDTGVGEQTQGVSIMEAIRTPGLLSVLAAYVCFVGFEAAAGVWAASFLEKQKGFDAASAALYSSLYFFGTTAGRGISGFVAIRIDSRRMIRLGFLLAFMGAVILALPLPRGAALAAYVLLGLGNAPIFPSMTFLTPQRFGHRISQTAIGLQMAAAYTGSTLIPPLTGILVRLISLQVVPLVTLFFVVAGFYFSQRIDARIQKHAAR